MGDRFYGAQKTHKPKRRLKADVIKELQNTLMNDVQGLDRLTIKTLDELHLAIKQAYGDY